MYPLACVSFSPIDSVVRCTFFGALHPSLCMSHLSVHFGCTFRRVGRGPTPFAVDVTPFGAFWLYFQTWPGIVHTSILYTPILNKFCRRRLSCRVLWGFFAWSVDTSTLVSETILIWLHVPVLRKNGQSSGRARSSDMSACGVCGGGVCKYTSYWMKIFVVGIAGTPVAKDTWAPLFLTLRAILCFPHTDREGWSDAGCCRPLGFFSRLFLHPPCFIKRGAFNGVGGRKRVHARNLVHKRLHAASR